MAIDPQADQAAFSKQYDEQEAAKAQQKQQEGVPQQFPQRWMAQVGRASLQQLDAAVANQPVDSPASSFAGGVSDPAISESPGMHKARDITAGAITGATNITDSVVSAAKSATSGGDLGPLDQYLMNAVGPVWDHAKAAILDFRDAVQVQDPTFSDNLTQGVAQLAIPYAGYSRALSGLHGFANMAAAGVVTDATALQPHDMRMADVLALERHTEGKFGAVLRTLAPDGSAVNAYINFLTDRGNESEAEGRFKNVLDGFGVNSIATPLLHAIGLTLKYGARGVRYAMENGALSSGDFFKMAPASGSPAAQRGMVAFHGTGADFDQFDTAAIGSGQGAQSYGHGLYFAENKAVAGGYSPSFANGNITPKDLREYYKPGETRDMSNGTKDTITSYDPKTGMVSVMRKDPRTEKPYPVEYRDRGADWARVRKALGQPMRSNGMMYTVDIGDEHVGKMLDWDAGIKKQPFEVVNALHKAGVDTSANVSGENAYEALTQSLGGPRAASEFLAKEGVPGIKYLDQYSRGKDASSQTRNLVLFDDKHANIVKKE